VLAVSPIIGGQAVKGPAAKMMAEMGIPVTARAVADYYGDMLDLFVYDERDETLSDDSGLAYLQTNTLMNNRDDRFNLAAKILQYSLEWSS
jgi:LPPG:FO 2-phospho-L-lactate transferase